MKDDKFPDKNNHYRNEQAAYVLDQKELNELLSVNVHRLALNSPTKDRQRKGSDEDVYVEETLIFVFNPNQQSNESEQSSPRKPSSTHQMSVEELRKHFLVEVHKYNEEDDLEREQRLLQQIMEDTYADAEIDNILETFSDTIPLNKIQLNGEFIENDIRLSEDIREAIDEIKQMQRPQNNKQGEIERRRFLQSYVETAELLGVSLTVEHLLPCLNEIFKQDDGSSSKGYVRLIFQNLQKLIDFLSSSEITVGYNGIRDHIMPLFNEFFQNDNIDETLKQDIQGEVIDLLVNVSKLMTNEDRAEKILPIILESIRDDSDEEKRILGLELVDKLAEQIGVDNCQNFLMYEIVSLQDDPIYRVRKETVIRMINISKVLGKEIFLRILFPVFKKLANDQIWGVRRSAVEVLPQISNLCPTEVKNGVLIEMFKKFSQDSSKWVKMATFQYLGPFIATYEGIEPSPVLIDYYINMCEQNKSSQPDNEVPYHCAYNFPAVLQTLGPKSWTKLQPVHEQLVKDQRWKVRRTLAYSLHEVAKILGPEITEKELIPVLYHFLKDVNEVKEGVTVTLPKFIKVLTPEQRENYIDQLAQTQIDTQDWRKRIAQAKQVKSFSKIFSAETVHKYYVPVFFQLCQDQVAEVRYEASKCARNLCIKLKDNEDLFKDFVSKCILFKESDKYNLRQIFVSMCESLMLEKSVFIEHFLPHFCDLQKDRVVNVRLVLSETLRNHFKSQPNGGLVQELKELRTLAKILLDDRSRDVRENIEDLNIQFLDSDSITKTDQVTANQEENKVSSDEQVKDSQEQTSINEISEQKQVSEVNVEEQEEVIEKNENAEQNDDQDQQQMNEQENINQGEVEEQNQVDKVIDEERRNDEQEQSSQQEDNKDVDTNEQQVQEVLNDLINQIISKEL